MVILGSTYGSDGGGWYRISDFAMLVERPKFLEAVVNKSVGSCKSVSECDIRAVSSAKVALVQNRCAFGVLLQSLQVEYSSVYPESDENTPIGGAKSIF